MELAFLMDLSEIRAVSFDLWVTLLRSDPGFKPRRNEALRVRFVPHLSPADFDAALRRCDKEADLLAERSGIDYGFTERLTFLFDRLGIVFDPTSAHVAEASAEQERLALEFPPLPYHVSLPGLVRELSTRVPLAVTSNTGMLPGSLMRPLLEKAGYGGAFTHLTFSNEVGENKPQPGIFEHTLTGLAAVLPGLTAEQVLHIGDNPVADVEGAARFGMQAALVNRSTPAARPVESFLATCLRSVAA